MKYEKGYSKSLVIFLEKILEPENKLRPDARDIEIELKKLQEPFL